MGKLEQAAQDIQGVRWVHQGRDPVHGLDCVGAALYLYQQAGWQPINSDLVNARNYLPRPKTFVLKEIVEQEAFEIAIEDAVVFDMILIRQKALIVPQHVAVVTSSLTGTRYITHHRSKLVCTHALDWSILCNAVAAYRMKGNLIYTR